MAARDSPREVWVSRHQVGHERSEIRRFHAGQPITPDHPHGLAAKARLHAGLRPVIGSSITGMARADGPCPRGLSRPGRATDPIAEHESATEWPGQRWPEAITQ